MPEMWVDARSRARQLSGAVAICLVVAGCAAQPPDASPKRTTGPVEDWRNTTVSLSCDGIVPGGFSARLVDGAARVIADVSETPDYTYFDVQVETTVVGDVDGDGAPDTVVLLACSPQPSNGIVEEAEVFDADGHLLGELPSPRTLRQALTIPPVYDPAGLAIEDGEIVAAMKVYEKDDTHAGGPSGHLTVRWRWDGQDFQRAS